MNPWLALPDGAPSPVITRRLRAAHEALVTSGDLPRGGQVRSVVLDSWRRALGSGVDPDGGPPPVDLTDDELIAYRDAHPLAAVMPVIRRLLVADAEADRMIVAVTDASGRMLWVEGDHALRSRAAGMHFVEGARWGEDVAGTNAPGTALALDHAVQIYGSEHYRRTVQPWSCSAAPVHDPVTGALLGAIDVTGGDHVASPHVLTLVRATVAAAESELRWLHHEQQHRSVPAPPPLRRPAPLLEVLGRERARLTLPPGPALSTALPPGPALSTALPPGPALSTALPPGPALLPDATRAGGRVELSVRHSELLLLLAEAAVAGEGRTADQLAAEVHPGAAAAVTVRAELSRLRRLLGDEVVGSRPYRLLGRLDSDLDQVRRLLVRGATAQALERYAGPVLPRSTAPGVVTARERLGAALRHAVLRSRRPELLLRYTRLPEVADDVTVWQACLDSLPTSSPRRAAVAAHLVRLRGPSRPR
ncbi:GAF domain-containing protein [Modestobacter sp. I12A-02628]|uniref:GAF domain-containing protein n=1 Tax=Goekera deserti TaxID=2497753 RepID=A0A7K3WJJ5_9ACTN|nr:GAF domain-containing protein [Goekera deserti]NDI49558.1 GAF domain-containing protein [Goekera deserti]NEL56665.1 GAF domain-containing protein [Goekera deserti]